MKYQIKTVKNTKDPKTKKFVRHIEVIKTEESNVSQEVAEKLDLTYQDGIIVLPEGISLKEEKIAELLDKPSKPSYTENSTPSRRGRKRKSQS